SEDSLAGRALSMRDEAFAELGDTDLSDGVVGGRSPEFSVTGVEDFNADENEHTQRRIRGEISVPNYLTYPAPLETPQVDDQTKVLPDELCHALPNDITDPRVHIPSQTVPGSRLNYNRLDPGPMDTAERNQLAPNLPADFICNIPRSAAAGEQ